MGPELTDAELDSILKSQPSCISTRDWIMVTAATRKALTWAHGWMVWYGESQDDEGSVLFAASNFKERLIGEGIQPWAPEARQQGPEAEVQCHAQQDGDCSWRDCPQVRDGEPNSSGRHCPLDAEEVSDA